MQNEGAQTLTPCRPDQTLAVTRGVMRMLIDRGMTPIAEFKLANGRRADVAALDRRGQITMVEVKSCRADFEIDQKWPEYRDYCDQFYFAVDQDFPCELLPDDEGLIIADGFGGSIQREAVARPLAAARRKAVTLRFARQAARHLARHNSSQNVQAPSAPNLTSV